MAFYNQNFIAVPLNTNDTFLGNIQTATTIHQLVCLTPGSISITAYGGGSFIWSATTSQSIDIMVGNCTVNSGSFVGFKTFHNQGMQSPKY